MGCPARDVDSLGVSLSPETVQELVNRVYAGFEAANALAGGLAGRTVTVLVAGSLATRRDRDAAFSIGDVEAIWTVLGSLSGLAIAPAPVADAPLLRAA